MKGQENVVALQQEVGGGLRELALFAGAGGGILGGKLLGWRTVCAVEFDEYARSVLVARQNDGCLEAFPIWDDVQTFDGTPWRGAVDVVSGGFPCQDISSAGKGAGIDGERSGMWKQMARICGEIRPRFILVENSPMLVGRGLAVVLGDLAEMGYDAEWGIVGAHHASAPHKRERIWIVATDATLNAGKQWRAECAGLQRQTGLAIGVDDMADASGVHDRRRNAGTAQRQKPEPRKGGGRDDVRHAAGEGLPHGSAKPMGEPGTDAQSERSDWWATEPDVGRETDGLAAKLDGHKAHD